MPITLPVAMLIGSGVSTAASLVGSHNAASASHQAADAQVGAQKQAMQYATQGFQSGQGALAGGFGAALQAQAPYQQLGQAGVNALYGFLPPQYRTSTTGAPSGPAGPAGPSYGAPGAPGMAGGFAPALGAATGPGALASPSMGGGFGLPSAGTMPAMNSQAQTGGFGMPNRMAPITPATFGMNLR